MAENLSIFSYKTSVDGKSQLPAGSMGQGEAFLITIEKEQDTMTFQIYEGLQLLTVQGTRKRKVLVEHSEAEMFSAVKRREIIEAVNEGIVQIC
ncbi:hypothetical protein V6N12_003152 [Hibiscus sabdariffa]|uniref:Uncharacterized protein n=1 Tax=Hibiscus sabdariffa TaxID=183260 RepID=A0ABR2EB26_9ROSI